MGPADWRSPAAYEHLRGLDAPGFAWEFLRRNPAFNKEREALREADALGRLDQARADDFTRRWGVRFRERRSRRRSKVGDLDGEEPTQRGRLDDGAAGDPDAVRSVCEPTGWRAASGAGRAHLGRRRCDRAVGSRRVGRFPAGRAPAAGPTFRGPSLSGPTALAMSLRA